VSFLNPSRRADQTIAPDNVINFSASIPAALNSTDTAASAFIALQDLVSNETIINRNLSLGIYTDVNGAFSLSGWYLGSQDTFNNTIFPAILQIFPSPASKSVMSKSWLDSLVSAAGGPLAQPLAGYDKHDTFYAKSVVTKEAEPVTLAAAKSFWSYVIDGRGQNEPWFSIINLYGGADSQINAPASDFSAYSGRDSLWAIQVIICYQSNEISSPNPAYRITAGLPTANFHGFLQSRPL
jgi:hypothetical protein